MARAGLRTRTTKEARDFCRRPGLIERVRVRSLIFLLGFALAVLLGYWLATTAAPRQASRGRDRVAELPPREIRADEAMPQFRHGTRVPGSWRDSEAAEAGAVEGQRVLVFKDQAALERFLALAGDQIRLLGRLDALHALRIGFADDAGLAGLLDGEAELSLIFPVSIPTPVEGTVQPGAVAMGNSLLDWLGITGDNSDWGKGVRIAILDTGVAASSAFGSTITCFNLVDLPADLSQQNGHGTAVASMIIGRDALTPGVAPGAEILSYRVADDNGQSDNFLLSQAIVAAVNAGAKLINISMGGTSDSTLMQSAIAYAAEHGVLIIAPAGNNGTNQISHPAANTGVIAVGSVDALGNHLDFSNSGDKLALATPGYGLNAAWTGDQAMSVSGTSFSAPIVAGAIAAIMTQAGTGNLTAAQAYQLLLAYLDDGGAAGKDPQLGAGMVDLGRVFNGTTPGIYDAAVASSRILAPDAGNPYGQVEVLVQNRGTESLVNTAVQVSVGTGTVTANLTSLAPDAVRTIRVPLTQPLAAYANGIRVDSRVTLASGLQDAKPSNDHRVETYVAPAAKK